MSCCAAWPSSTLSSVRACCSTLGRVRVRVRVRVKVRVTVGVGVRVRVGRANPLTLTLLLDLGSECLEVLLL